MLPEETLTWPLPQARPVGTTGNSVLWLGMPTQPPPTVEIASGRKPVDLEKVPVYLRDTGRFRR